MNITPRTADIVTAAVALAEDLQADGRSIVWATAAQIGKYCLLSPPLIEAECRHAFRNFVTVAGYAFQWDASDRTLGFVRSH